MGKLRKKKKLFCSHQSFQSVSGQSSKEHLLTTALGKDELTEDSVLKSPLKSFLDYEKIFRDKPFGISSFKGFILSSNNSCENIFALQSENGRKISINRINYEKNDKENKNSQPALELPLAFPNILRHKRSNFNLTTLSDSPLKALTFSPSKFFNRSRVDELVLSDYSTHDFLSSSICDLEDSGIVLSENDAVCPISGLPLTSTPSSSSRQKFQQTLKIPFDEELHVKSDFESISKTLNERKNDEQLQIEKSIESPVVHRFLKLSVPRTPTPFKNVPDISQTSDCILAELSNESSTVKKENGFEIVQHGLESKVESNSSKESICKNSFRRTLFDRKKCKSENSYFEVPTSHNHVLAENKLCLKRKNALSFGKSICVTKKSKELLKFTPMTSRWVNVACGQSNDQRLMTAAAKQYLHEQ